MRAHRERTLPRGAVAGGRRGAVNVPATSTSTTIQPVVVTLPLPSGSAAACAAAAARCGSPCRTPRYKAWHGTALVSRHPCPFVSVCTVRVRASAMGIDRLEKDRRRRGRATPFVSVRLTPDEREPRLERRCPACPT